jgi:hypothetical protein
VDGIVAASSANRGEFTIGANEAELLESPAWATAPIPKTSPVTPAITFLTFIAFPFQRSHYVEIFYKTPIFLT